MKQDPKHIEVMAPVGSYESLMAAINAGANSVYFGIEQLNMRARAANNFTIEDLKKIAAACKEHGVKSYLTLNTILYDHDINLAKRICDAAKEAGVSAIIACDVAVIMYARSIDLDVHISTQANVSNVDTIKFYSQYSDVIVLARELTLKQIATICDEIVSQDIRGPKGELVRIEIFVHGALCVAVSGKCYMSLATYNASANRGACLQNCRRSYRVIDEETGVELSVDNKYIMSPKDLCTIGFIDKLLDAGVSVLKIEGRGRKADYVHVAVSAYREAVDCVLDGTYTKEKINEWIRKLETVYNRGFWHGGYYLGKELGEWSGVYGSKATKEKSFVGRCMNYYNKTQIACFHVETGEVCVGDEILITGPTTGAIQSTIKEMYVDDKSAQSCSKGKEVTFKVSEKVRKNDKLFVIKNAKNRSHQG